MSRTPLSRPVTPALLRGWPIPQPDPGDDKDGRGSVLVVAGAPELPGAAILAATSALRVGAGKLQVATCRSIAGLIGISLPEALVVGLPHSAAGGLSLRGAALLADHAKRAQAVLCGPGLCEPRAIGRFLKAMIPMLQLEDAVLVLDAEALKCLNDDPTCLRKLKGRAIITPHAGEMAQILGVAKSAIERAPLKVAREFAARSRAVVVLKGQKTFIAAPDGKAYENRSGTVGLATSGSGDTLAGLIAGLAARGAPPIQAAVWGVALHARAGERLERDVGRLGFLAHELPARIPKLLEEMGSRQSHRAARRAAG